MQITPPLSVINVTSRRGNVQAAHFAASIDMVIVLAGVWWCHLPPRHQGFFHMGNRQRWSTCICCCIAEEQWSSELLYAEQNPFSNMRIIHLASVCVKIPTCPGFSQLDLQGPGVTDIKMHIDQLPLSACAKRQPLWQEQEICNKKETRWARAEHWYKICSHFFFFLTVSSLTLIIIPCDSLSECVEVIINPGLTASEN